MTVVLWFASVWLICGVGTVIWLWRAAAERVNDFATPGVMNLLCRVAVFERWLSPLMAG
jgi:hypothetical protein